MKKPIIGIIGNGQLGRMLTQIAIQYGHTVHTFGPNGINSPSALAGAVPFSAEYEDLDELQKFIESADLFTFEFENIPEPTLMKISELTQGIQKKVYPSPENILLTQNRIQEKSLANKLNIPTSLAHHSGINEEFIITKPMILKTAKFGYDGKGQFKINDQQSFNKIKNECKETGWVLENIIDFDYELSLISVRFPSGKTIFYPPCLNKHKNHILDTTFCPYPLEQNLHDKLKLYTTNFLNEINYIGVSAIEYFIKDDTCYFNEIAPRPHNSGHFSQNCGSFSQFELQLFSLIGIEIDQIPKVNPTVMKNLIGDDYKSIPQKLMNNPKIYPPFHFHFYQKSEIRSGRKMGHVNFQCNWEDFPKEFQD
jgi:5-(carboxyamino)imidazole ribonucleotide synthase